MDGIGSMKEEEELEFERLWRKRQDELRGIIVVMGPPTTMKTLVAQYIGKWAKCPALCIQDFFTPRTTATTAAAEANDAGKESAVAADKEVVQVQQHAFTALCKVASRHMEFDINKTVVIKSRLSSTFELQRLFDNLILTCDGLPPLLFIECRFTNEYRWRQYFESAREREDDFSRWYRPGSWEEMDKATRDYDSQSHHLTHHLPPHDHVLVRRLVVDPEDDIFSRSFLSIPVEFTDAIKYLLTTPKRELLLDFPQQNHPPNNNSHNESDYTVVELRELRPILFEKRVMARLAAANGRNTHTYCPGGQCVFQYIESGQPPIQHDVVCCGVCGEQVDPSASSYYACRLCILTLHKPCAQRLPFNALSFSLGLLFRNPLHFSILMPEEHACKPCSLDRGGTGFNLLCGACQLQTHLKCGLLPTIIHHNSHPPHFLSLLVTNQYYRCSACGDRNYDFAYSCRPCGLYYHLKCALLPLQLLRHQHGGHEHVMRLLYSHHDTDQPDEEEEESYWCDVCGKDMDPHNWCYSCQDCPYYSAHLHCARGYEYLCSNVKNSVFIPQIQSQLEAAMAEVNSETPSEK